MRFYYSIALLLLINACSGHLPIEKIKVSDAQNVEITTLSGNYNIEDFHTKSRIRIFENKKNESGEIVEILKDEKTEEARFKLNRSVMDVDTSEKIQYKHWVSDFKGKTDLASMGFPPVGQALFSIINNKAEVVAVKGVPLETIFYVPRIPLPKKAVKVGDTWDFVKQWRSLKTGWPFIAVSYTHLTLPTTPYV